KLLLRVPPEEVRLQGFRQLSLRLPDRISTHRRGAAECGRIQAAIRRRGQTKQGADRRDRMEDPVDGPEYRHLPRAGLAPQRLPERQYPALSVAQLGMERGKAAVADDHCCVERNQAKLGWGRPTKSFEKCRASLPPENGYSIKISPRSPEIPDRPTEQPCAKCMF